MLELLLHHRLLTLGIFLRAARDLARALPLFVIGTDFFPAADAGIMKFHFARPQRPAHREHRKARRRRSSERIRQIIPADELETINVNIGVPIFYNLAFVPTDNVGRMDAEILIALKEEHHPTATVHRRRSAQRWPATFPSSVIYFQPADIVSQVLNFGLSAPIDVQFKSRNVDQAYELAKQLRDAMRLIPGAADVAIRQVFDYPTLRVNVDRERAAQTGLAQSDVANSMLTLLSSSSLVSPSFYVNPENNVNYTVVVKSPRSSDRNRVSDLTAHAGHRPGEQCRCNQPRSTSERPRYAAGALGTDASAISRSINRRRHRARSTTINVQRVVDVIASSEGRDLGGSRLRYPKRDRQARQRFRPACESSSAARARSCTSPSASSGSAWSWP